MPDNTLLDRSALENEFGGYQPPSAPVDLPKIPFTSLSNPMPQIGDAKLVSPLDALENYIQSTASNNGGMLTGGSIPRSLKDVTSSRYNNFVPGDYNNEDAYGQGQSWASKMVNSVGKGLVLTGTTFLQSTAGLVNGLAQSIKDGRAASFYDNEFNRSIDELNKQMEDALPNYYTDVEKNAAWYSPSKLFTANFFWDGIIKNMGFAAGAYLSGAAFTSIFKALPLTSRLFSVGKAAETLAATEEALISADKAAETFGKVKQLSDKFLGSYKTLNAGGRALVAGLSTTGEAGFEAYQNLNQFRNDKIQEYKDKYGVEPTGEALAQINRESDNVGNASFLLNVGLLSVTNFIQFPKILGSSYKAEKGIINGIEREIGDISQNAAGEYVQNVAKTRFGKILSGVNKIRPYTFSTSEAFEEGAQYAIQVGTQDYYNKKYKGDASRSFLGSLMEGVSETFGTDEGMQNVLIGGLSGALMMGKSRFSEQRDIRTNTADAISKFNKHRLSDFVKDTMESVNRGTVLQEEREASLKQGDILESKDKEADYVINYLTPRIKYGRFDLVKSDIESYKQLASTDQGFAQLQAEGKALATDTKEAYLQRLANLESTAENMKSLYQSLNIRYSGALNNDGKPMFKSEVLDKMVYAATKVADYDNRIPKIATELLASNIDTADIIEEARTGKTEARDKAIAAIDPLDMNREDKIQAIIDIAEASARRQKFLEEYTEMKKTPSKFEDVKDTVEQKLDESGKPITNVKIKTKKGDEDIEIGTEYFLGKVVEYDKNGKEVYRFPKLTILGENADGTIKIKDSATGQIKDISKDVLLDYNLGKVSDTLNNKKAKFYMENINTIFTFNLGKTKGGKVLGRLEWNNKGKILNFVYKNKKGEIKRIEVTGDMFVAKEGFTNPLIEATGKLTAVQQKSIQEAAEEARKGNDERVAKKRETRIKILTDLFDSISQKVDKINNLVTQKKSEIENISKELSDLEDYISEKDITKRKNFRTTTSQAISAANRLSRMKDQLVREIEELESQKEELEFNQSYIADMAQNIDELPTDSQDFLQEIKNHKEFLEDMIVQTGLNINSISKIIKSVEGALDSAINMIKELINKFEKTYPGVPTAMGQAWVDFLKENPNFLKINTSFKEDLAQVEDIIAQVEDLDIVPNERTIKELNENVDELNKNLKEFEKELSATNTILEAFNDFVEKYKQEEAEKKLLAKNEEFVNAILGTADTSEQTTQYDRSFEPDSKKSDIQVVTSTSSTSDKEHGKRANRFGIRFPKISKDKNIKGVLVTKKNEDQIIPGLIDRLTEGTDVNKDKVIALVMVQDNGDGDIVLVDENGEPLTNDSVKLDTAIYQVFPEEKLEWDMKYSKDGKTAPSMFRETTPDEVRKSLKEQYAKWRKDVIDNPSLTPLSIDASFGITEKSTYKDDKGVDQTDYRARNAVTETGLISEDDLEESKVIVIRTTEGAESNGSVTFNDAMGKPLLKTENGLVKLDNRKLSKNEAELLFDMISRLAKNIATDMNAKSEDSQLILQWLKSVVYWGIPKTVNGVQKTAGRNSIWFQKDENGVLKLFVSGEDTDVAFGPKSLEQNKPQLLALFQELYNNVNSTMVNKDWNEPYVEIIGINKDGSFKTRNWSNYQSYLLSNKDPEGNARKSEEIPLTTTVRPLKSEDDVNKKGVYFTITDNIDKFIIPQPKPNIGPKVITPGAPTITPPSTVTTPTSSSKFDGTTENKMPLGKYGEVPFTLDIKQYVESNGQKGLSITFPKEIVTALMNERSIDEEKAQNIIGASIIAKLQPEIQAYKTQQSTIQTSTPTPPSSDIQREKFIGDVSQEALSDISTEDVSSVIKKLNDNTTKLKVDVILGKDFGTDNKITNNQIIYLLHSEGKKIAVLSINDKTVTANRPESSISGVLVHPDLKGKGLGKAIYRFVNNDLISKGRPVLKSDFDITPDAIRVWESLVKSGEAIKTGINEKYNVPTFEMKSNAELAALEGKKPISTTTQTQEQIRKVFPLYNQALSELEDWVKSGKTEERFYESQPNGNVLQDPLGYLKNTIFLTERSIKDSDKTIKTFETSPNAKDADVQQAIERIKRQKETAQNSLASLKETLSKVEAIVGKTTVKTEKTTTDVDAILTDLANNPSKSISDTDDPNEPAIVVQFSRNQKEDERYMEMEGGFEDAAEAAEVFSPKGNYFTVSGDFGNSFEYHEGDPKLKEIVKNILSKKGKQPTAPINQFTPQPTQYDLTGLTENTMALGNFGDVKFSLDVNEYVKTGKGFNIDVSSEMITKVMEAKQVDKEKAVDIIAQSVLNKFKSEIETAKQNLQPIPQPTTGQYEITAEDREKIRQQMANSSKDINNDFRVKIENEIKNFEGENWNDVVAWLKKVFPNVPVYRVKNVIKATNGRQAWGMFKDGAIYIYENAEVGTAYHEVFEAVWKMFTSEDEQNSVWGEFKNRKGTFIDRPTGREIKYSEATRQEAKEQLAEEFRDYVRFGKIPQKPESGKPFIIKLFSDLVNFIKTFFTGKSAKSNTEKLFEKIGNGYYKQYHPYHSTLSFAKEGIIDIEDASGDENSEFSIIGLSGQERHDIIQHMTYLTLGDILKNNRGLFSVPNLNKTELYAKLKDQVQQTIGQTFVAIDELINSGKITAKQAEPQLAKAEQLWKAVELNWEKLQAKHEEYLRGYSIEFDENDEAQFKNEDKIKESNYQDATKIDSFRKANSAIKLLLSTVAKVDANGKILWSTINGATLLSTSEVFIKIMNKVHSARNIDEMLERVRQMAIADPNYRKLYERLTKSSVEREGVDWTKLTEEHDAQLIAAFWKTFKKMNADAKVVFILANGDISIGDSNLASAARQARIEFTGSMNAVMKSKKSPYFTYDDKLKTYFGNPKNVNSVKLTGPETRIAFLDKLGIKFTMKDFQKLDKEKKKLFNDAVDGIRTSLMSERKIATFSGKILDIEGRLLELGLVKATIDNPEFDSTFFNVNGERTQSYIGTNPASDLYDVLSQINNINDLKGTQYEYLLTDSFAKNSVVLNKMFNMKTGNKREDANKYLKVGYVDGMNNENTGKRKQSSKLNYRERLIQEINLNLAGYYMNLVPGDASMEWMLFMDNAVSEKSLLTGMQGVYDIFKGYLMSEIELSKDNRNVKEKNGRNKTDLRFFKSILGKQLHDKIVRDSRTIEEIEQAFEKDYAKDVNKAIKDFIEKDVEQFQNNLLQYGIIRLEEKGWVADSINLKEKEEITTADLKRQLTAMSVNYMINNIELHKVLYSDPYQYSDELKRMKNFNSPRQPLLSNSDGMNGVFHRIWNKAFKKGDFGYYDFNKDYMQSATIGDVTGIIDLPDYENFEETDGGGMILLSAYRNFLIRAGEWTESNEKQYKYDVEYEKLVKSGASKQEIEKFEKNNPEVKSTYTPIKPIVSGNKGNGKKYNDIILDKFALYPLSFRILHKLNSESNAVKLYNKMQKDNIDYVVYESGRKVGASKANQLYREDGQFNTDSFEEIIKVPYKIMSVQSEVPSKDSPIVTRGSQITKLATLDFMEAGVPVDFMSGKKFKDRYKEWNFLSEAEKLNESELYKEIKNNQNLLEEMMDNSFQSLLNRFGIIEEDGGFVIKDFKKAGEILKEEILKREVNDNISIALQGFIEGKVLLEATPAYQQVRNILYSIADKEVISPKISGGLKVQIPSTLLESERVKLTEINGKKGYTSDVLDFYKDEDGKRVCKIMIGRWFDSNMSDKELLEYLNETEEGQKILSGIGFRTPTQRQNSIDVFKIEKFLPKEFGDSIVIPAALVKKSGSDFDIDKLSVYLKNIYKDGNGKIKVVPFYGYGDNAKNQFEDLFFDILQTKIDKANAKVITTTNLRGLFSDLSLGIASNKTMSKWIPIFKEMFEKETEDGKLKVQEIEEKFMKKLESLGKKIGEFNDWDFQQILLEEFKEEMYKKSLENAYIESLQNLVSHPKNFSKLISPNSADQLKSLSKKVTEKLGEGSFDYSSVGNMLSRNYMSKLRHAFVSGKYAIGIAAVNQTNHALNQRAPIYIDLSKLKNLDPSDKKFLRDGLIKFAKYNSIEVNDEMVATLSMIQNADGQDISDIIAQFIDGYVDISKGPWIMEMGAGPNVASTFLFLAKIGVPIEDVVYFMNQPIIRDHLRNLETAGYSWLFIDSFVKDAMEQYASDVVEPEVIPSKENLYQMIGNKKLTPEQNANQRFILLEFLKYAKMANQLFLVTQGTNFDTASFNDPYLVFKKSEMLKKAQNSIISSADLILEKSFIGKLGNTIGKIRNSLSTMLASDRSNVRSVIEKVLLPYVDLPDRDFVKLSQKAVSDLFDWAVQTDKYDNGYQLNGAITNIMLNDNNVAKDMLSFIKTVKEDPKHPLHDNVIINLMQPIISEKLENGTNNIKIKAKDNKIYDQNQMIYGFEEFRKYCESMVNKPEYTLYKRLMALSVLQSGLSTSPVAFTSLLPYEDFKKIYEKTLSNLEQIPNLNEFYELNVFERNNWNNDDIVPFRKARWIKYVREGNVNYLYNVESKFKNKKVMNAMSKGAIPKLIQISNLSREAQKDIIVFTWEIGTKKEKEEMRKKGDYSYIKKGLFKKVYQANGVDPFEYSTTSKSGVVYDNYVYKMINAWGDSHFANGSFYGANEFYDVAKKSVIDNGFIKVEKEVIDDLIINYFEGTVVEEIVDFDKLTEFDSKRKKEIISNFAAKHKMTKEATKAYINEALQKDRENTISKLKECY